MNRRLPPDLHDHVDWHESPARGDRWGCVVGLAICCIGGFAGWMLIYFAINAAIGLVFS